MRGMLKDLQIMYCDADDDDDDDDDLRTHEWWWPMESIFVQVLSRIESQDSSEKDCIPDTFVMISYLSLLRSTSSLIFCRFLLATFVLCWELQVGPSSLCRTFNRQPWSRNC
jgi:hypothetical protein